MYPQPDLSQYQRQANDLVAKIANLQQMQNAQPLQSPAYVPAPEQIHYVKGMDGAKEYLAKMAANSNAVLMDYDEAKFYVVSKDANGNPAPVSFANFQLEFEKPPEEPAYVTKQDFDDFKEELRALIGKGAQE